MERHTWSLVPALGMAISLVTPPCYGQTPTTFGLDAQNWRAAAMISSDSAVTKFAKIVLLRGILDGLVFGKSPLIMHDSINVDTTFEFLIGALDQFYSDYPSERVFLVWALQIISMESKGTPPSVVEARLVEMRRRAADLHKARP